jgi:predicted esterase
LESVTVSLEVEYLLHIPTQVDSRTVLVLTLHGFGMNPETMLRLTVPAVGDDCVVASLRAPNQGYVSGSPASSEVGYNWGTRSHPELNIRLHHDIVRAVAGGLRERFSIPASRTMLLGFSQPVGLNYRFIGTHPDQAGGVVGICGGVPKNWEDPSYHAVTAPVLHISRDQDEYFPVETVRGFPARLRAHCSDVEFHLLPGSHRFPSKAGPMIREWMNRVYRPQMDADRRR